MKGFPLNLKRIHKHYELKIRITIPYLEDITVNNNAINSSLSGMNAPLIRYIQKNRQIYGKKNHFDKMLSKMSMCGNPAHRNGKNLTSKKTMTWQTKAWPILRQSQTYLKNRQSKPKTDSKKSKSYQTYWWCLLNTLINLLTFWPKPRSNFFVIPANITIYQLRTISELIVLHLSRLFGPYSRSSFVDNWVLSALVMISNDLIEEERHIRCEKAAQKTQKFKIFETCRPQTESLSLGKKSGISPISLFSFLTF